MRVAARIMGGLAEHGEKQLGGHELAARARDKKAAGFDHFHTAQVQLLVAAIGVIERFAAFGEGGRVADDEAELLLLVGPRFGKVEDVFTDGGDFVFHAVERGVAANEGKRLLGDVDGGDVRCAVERGVDREAAGTAAEVQNGLVFAIRANTAAVFLLVEEVTGFLAVWNGDEHARVVFADFKLIGDGAVDAGLELRQTFFFADGKIVALVDALWLEEIDENVYDNLLPRL